MSSAAATGRRRPSRSEIRYRPMSSESLLRRGRKLVKKGQGKHVETFSDVPQMNLIVDVSIPLSIDNGIATGAAGAEAHEDMMDEITVIEGALELVIGDIIIPKILIDREGDAIATETRGSGIIIKRKVLIKAGQTFVVEAGKGHLHGNVDDPNTPYAITKFTKVPFIRTYR